MIVKTKENPLGSFYLGSMEEKEVSSFDGLVVEETEINEALPGISDENVLENSTIVTDYMDIRTGYSAITADAAGATKLYNGDVMSRPKVQAGLTHALNLAPFGICFKTLADSSGFASAGVPRVGLPLPTTKLRKFMNVEQELFENMGMVSAKQITIASGLFSQAQRINYMYQVNSILGMYQAMLNRVAGCINYFKYVGPRIGMAPSSNLGINNERIQRLLAEIACNIKDLPILDLEYHSRIQSLCRFYYTQRRGFKSPTVTMPALFIAMTDKDLAISSSDSTPKVLLTDGQDAVYSDTYANKLYGSLSSSNYDYMTDRSFNAAWLSDILFSEAVGTTGVLTITEGYLAVLAVHSGQIKTLYAPYFQYLRFAISKGWFAPKTLEEYLDWNITDSADVSVKDIPVVYGHHIATLNNYAPFAMQVEGLANNAWTPSRVHAPLLIDKVTSNPSNAFGKLLRYVDAGNLGSKGPNLAELCSWGVWCIIYDASSSSETASDCMVITYANPFDGLIITGKIWHTWIDSGPMIKLSQLQSEAFICKFEDANRRNVIPVFAMVGSTFQGTLFSAIVPTCAVNPLIIAGQNDWFEQILQALGHVRTIRSCTNVGGHHCYHVVFLRRATDECYTEINVIDLIKAAPQYFASKLLEIKPVLNKVTK